ncbi:MAG: hypothetical protein JXI32_01850 [Deltaproteobacteria bacterium]|nr:hypothetical protein [Deltaproteobacteria bacterium]
MENEGIKTFTAGEDLEAKRRVKIKSGTTSTPPELVYADAGEDWIGVTRYAVDSGDPIAVKLNNYPGTFEIECVVDSEIARGTVLYGAADGKVSDAASGTAQGIAMETGEDDAIIEVAPWNVKSTTAATVSIADSGGYTSQSTVEGALQEILPKAPVAVADPGDAGAIPVTRSGSVAITTVDAETRTLAVPGVAGITLALSLDVDGGDCVVTVAAAINQAGNNTITLDDAGDTIVLTAVQVAAGLVWRVLVNDGCSLSTV